MRERARKRGNNASQTEIGLPSYLLTLRKCVAFTLAEVLITLGIIGVVAAITMPSMIESYREKRTVAQLKKAYSALSQAFLLAQQENGNVSEWGLGYTYDAQTHITLANNFKRYMKVSVDCVGQSQTYTQKNCTVILSDIASYTSFITNDGALLIFRNWAPKCNLFGKCGTVYIDTNGKKGPNAHGKDMFIVWVQNDRLLPAGAQQDYFKFEQACNRTIPNPYPHYVGQFGACTAWVLYNENMDYLHCDGLSWDGAKSCKELH